MGLSGNRPSANLPTDVNVRVARAAGEKMVPLLSAAFEQMLTQAGDLSKWILASLVTLNGGVIVVLGNVGERLPGMALSQAIGWFSAGCILAMLTGLVGMLSAFMTSEPMGDVLGFWIRVRTTGEFDQDENKRLARRLTIRGLFSFGVAVFFGIASLACFGMGASGLANQIQTNSHQSSSPAMSQPPITSRHD